MVTTCTEYTRSKNSTLRGKSCCFLPKPTFICYFLYNKYQVQSMQLFKVTLDTIAYTCTTCTEYTRSRKYHVLRRGDLTRKLLLFSLLQYIYCTYYVQKMTLFVTTCTEYTRSRKFHFLRRGDLTRKLFLFSLLQYILHILGPENATFLGNYCYYRFLQL